MKKEILIKFEKASLLWKRSGFWGGLKTIINYGIIFLRAFFVGSGEVLFISSGVGDSALYRAYNPAEELRLHGFKAATTVSDNPNLQKLANKFDIFVFHRVVVNENIKKFIEKIKKQNKEIIFDTDDLVYDPSYLQYMDYFQKISPAEQEVYKKGIGKEIIEDSYVKVCTTTTSYLANKLCEKNKQVIIVPNKFSNAEWEYLNKIAQKEKMEDGLVWLVYYSGTLSHNKDFETIREALLNVLDKYENVKLLIIGLLDLPKELIYLKNRIELIPRVPRKELFSNLQKKADINLAPLELGNPFCESKSAIKFTGPGALGIPTVAVRNQTFSEAISEGEDGFLADNAEEWVEKLSQLIENKDLRLRMGKAAREKILQNYTNKNSHNEQYYNYLRSKIKK